jgi:hypothetical protein
MDKLDDVRQVKVATVEAAARIVAENLSAFVVTSGKNRQTVIAGVADATSKLALVLERHVWSSAQVGGSR